MTALHLVTTAVLAVTLGPAPLRESTRPLIPVVPTQPPALGMVFFGGTYMPGPYVFEKKDDGDALIVTLLERVVERLPRAAMVKAGKNAAEMEQLRERTIEAYEQILAKGGAIVLLDRMQITMPAVRVRDHLIPTLRLLDDRGLDAAFRRNALIEIWNDESIVDELTSTYRHDEMLWDQVRLIESGR